VNAFPWLTTLGVVPLVGAFVVAALPRGQEKLAKRTALGFSLAALLVAILAATRFDSGGAQFQLVEQHEWIRSFGVSYALGVDGIALVLILMAAVLVPVVILASWDEADGARTPVKAYFALVLVLETMIVGVFSATDVFLFYVFFEAMLIPVYFLIGSFGGPQRSYAAVKFLLYSLLGGLLMLAALIALYVVSADKLGTGTFDYAKLVGLDIDPTTQKWLFLGFFTAFAIKAPLWPVHTWLPDAAAESTPGTAVLLVGILDKVGTFGMIRLCLPLFPDAAKYFTPLVLVLATVGVLYGALVAIGQTDMMRLIAYTSLSHFGFITLGIFAMTSQGQSGSTLYMVNHGFSTAGLFIVAGFLASRRGSRLIADYGGVQRVAPLLAGFFLVMGLATLALPGLNSFVSEFMVLIGTYTRYPVYAVLATLGMILAAIYVLLWYQRVAHGPATEAVKQWRYQPLLLNGEPTGFILSVTVTFALRPA
jgi:NADH-quinone oxidoreductase subunit M